LSLGHLYRNSFSTLFRGSRQSRQNQRAAKNVQSRTRGSVFQISSQAKSPHYPVKNLPIFIKFDLFHKLKFASRTPRPPEILLDSSLSSIGSYQQLAKNELYRKLENLIGISVENKKILFTIGHLVKRKGVAWFVANVMPRLEDSYLYVVAGEGPEGRTIQNTVDRYDLHGRVLLLGAISDADRKLIYDTADVFIMPNISVPGDVEGFGIVILEAGTCGLPVVASNIQGLRDAVIDGETGYLVEERDVEGFAARIKDMNLEKHRIRKIVNTEFNWEKIYERYRAFLFSCSGR
jgi:glycosyltransferase involved in cell wall biosynthesis